jgi:transketolase
VQHIDGHDHAQIQRRARRGRRELVGKPKLIVARTRIGIGAPNEGGLARRPTASPSARPR